MRYFLIFMFYLTSAGLLSAQDTVWVKPDWGEYLVHDIFIGYNGSPTENSQLRNNYHSIEVGLWRSKVLQYNHPVSSSIYIGQEIGLSSKNLIHGTKIGGQVAAFLFIFGAELTHHTDYRSHSATISPYIGYGLYPFRLTFAWRARLTNKEFMPLSSLNVNVSFRILKLKSKKVRD